MLKNAIQRKYFNTLNLAYLHQTKTRNTYPLNPFIIKKFYSSDYIKFSNISAGFIGRNLVTKSILAKGSLAFASLFSVIGTSQQLLLAKKLESTIKEAEEDGIITEEEQKAITKEAFDLFSTLPGISSLNNIWNYLDFTKTNSNSQLLETLGDNILEHTDDSDIDFIESVSKFVIDIYHKICDK
ncbi:hypothetical protein HDU92_001875 [Lobulomyces angularis]|nr:hypothetical protein HDU92_001875 [Lobulomyces angularis]